MAHDAASGYLGRGLVNEWTKTQYGTFVDQLNCGARAFDARPALDEDLGLVWHHGPVIIDHAFAASMEEIKGWAAENTEALVIMGISDCIGDGCNDAVVSALADAGIPTVTDCSIMESLTLGQAEDMAQLEGGGMILAFTGDPANSGVACSYGNYDSTLGCSGFADIDEAMWQELCVPVGATPHTHVSEYTYDEVLAIQQCALALDKETVKNLTKYSCYETDPTHEYPENRLLDSLDGVSAQGPPSNGYFSQMQALYQETTETVILGTLARSSLLDDEQRSFINDKVDRAMAEGRWPYISFLEANNVCDGGLGLADRIWEHRLALPKTQQELQKEERKQAEAAAIRDASE